MACVFYAFLAAPQAGEGGSLIHSSCSWPGIINLWEGRNTNRIHPHSLILCSSWGRLTASWCRRDWGGSPWRMWEPCTHIEEYSACPRQYLHCASSSQHPACLLHVHSALGAHNCLRNELLWLAACDCGTQLPRSV